MMNLAITMYVDKRDNIRLLFMPPDSPEYRDEQRSGTANAAFKLPKP